MSSFPAQSVNNRFDVLGGAFRRKIIVYQPCDTHWHGKCEKNKISWKTYFHNEFQLSKNAPICIQFPISADNCLCTFQIESIISRIQTLLLKPLRDAWWNMKVNPSDDKNLTVPIFFSSKIGFVENSVRESPNHNVSLIENKYGTVIFRQNFPWSKTKKSLCQRTFKLKICFSIN